MIPPSKSTRWLNSVLKPHQRTDRLLRDYAAERVGIGPQEESYAWRKLLAAIQVCSGIGDLCLVVRPGPKRSSYVVYAALSGREIVWLPCIVTASTPALRAIYESAMGIVPIERTRNYRKVTDEQRRFIPPDKIETRLVRKPGA